MEAESHYASDGEIAYIRVRSPHRPVRSEEQPWGLRDFDEQTGVLVGLEVWSASRVLPEELSLHSAAGRWRRASSADRPDCAARCNVPCSLSGGGRCRPRFRSAFGILPARRRRTLRIDPRPAFGRRPSLRLPLAAGGLRLLMKVSMLREVNDPQLSLDVRQRPSFSDQLGGKAVPERLRMYTASGRAPHLRSACAAGVVHPNMTTRVRRPCPRQCWRTANPRSNSSSDGPEAILIMRRGEDRRFLAFEPPISASRRA